MVTIFTIFINIQRSAIIYTHCYLPVFYWCHKRLRLYDGINRLVSVMKMQCALYEVRTESSVITQINYRLQRLEQTIHLYDEIL